MSSATAAGIALAAAVEVLAAAVEDVDDAGASDDESPQAAMDAVSAITIAIWKDLAARNI
jgi:hypothetical protein